TPSPQPAPTRRGLGTALLFLAVLAGALLYPRLSYPLFEPDEGRRAEVGREMFASGDWLLPTLNGEPYYDKPPLFHWLLALTFHAFGARAAPPRPVPRHNGPADHPRHLSARPPAPGHPARLPRRPDTDPYGRLPDRGPSARPGRPAGPVPEPGAAHSLLRRARTAAALALVAGLGALHRPRRADQGPGRLRLARAAGGRPSLAGAGPGPAALAALAGPRRPHPGPGRTLVRGGDRPRPRVRLPVLRLSPPRPLPPGQRTPGAVLVLRPGAAP